MDFLTALMLIGITLGGVFILTYIAVVVLGWLLDN
jgi:hypothetical protein